MGGALSYKCSYKCSSNVSYKGSGDVENGSGVGEKS